MTIVNDSIISINSVNIQINCSKFMRHDTKINDTTVFLVSDMIYRSHDLYLILNFIYTKYKHLIFDESYSKNIENYVRLFESSTSIAALPSYEISSIFIKYEYDFYKENFIGKFTTIEEYFENYPDTSSIILIDKESYLKNQYICYMKE